MRKNYEVLQEGSKDCGSACLLSVIRYYGGNIPLNKLIDMTYTTKEGTSFYNLKEAAYELGMSAKAYYVKDLSYLPINNLPIISQVTINNFNHFVVIYKISPNDLTIMDPSKGITTINKSDFILIWTGYFLMLEPYKSLPILNDEPYIKNILINLFYNNITLIINILLLTIITTIVALIYSYHFQLFIDNINTQSSFNIKVILYIFIIIVLIKYITIYLRSRVVMYASEKIDLSILTAVTDKILSLPLSYYRNKRTGDTISRINDLMCLKNLIIKILTVTLPDTLIAIPAICLLFAINSRLTFLLLLIVLIYLLVFMLYKPIFKRLTNLNQETNARLNSLLVESISSYETIKGLNMEEYFKDKIANTYLDTIDNNLTITKNISTSDLIKNSLESIITLIIIYLGIKTVMDKSLTLGSLITYNSIIYYFLTPISHSLDLYREISYAKNSVTRINSLLNYESESSAKPRNLNILGGIYIKNLSFSYDKHTDIIKCITLEIKPCAKVLLLGSSGGGKSTLLKLLYKYYEVPRDKIFLSGYDLNDFNLSDIRKNIAYISQNEFLYSDTIRNNIILDRNVDELTFLTTCALTNVDTIIKDKAISYDYRLEENGANLSSGERSRVILARAILKNAHIILIDEALNALDTKLSRTILKKLFKVYPQKIFIVVAHRTDNIDLFTQVIKINNGTLVEGLNKYV